MFIFWGQNQISVMTLTMLPKYAYDLGPIKHGDSHFESSSSHKTLLRSSCSCVFRKSHSPAKEFTAYLTKELDIKPKRLLTKDQY
jgi:hypothetical protein